jgi:hypothetical protein
VSTPSSEHSPSGERFDRHEAHSRDMSGFDWKSAKDGGPSADEGLLSWRRVLRATGVRHATAS